MRNIQIIILSVILGFAFVGSVSGAIFYFRSHSLDNEIYYSIRDPSVTDEKMMWDDMQRAHKASVSVTKKFYWPMVGSIAGMISSIISLVVVFRMALTRR